MTDSVTQRHARSAAALAQLLADHGDLPDAAWTLHVARPDVIDGQICFGSDEERSWAVARYAEVLGEAPIAQTNAMGRREVVVDGTYDGARVEISSLLAETEAGS